jgi:hypothetical protein
MSPPEPRGYPENVRNAKLLTAAAISLLFLDQPVFAQSNCKEAKGNLSEVWLPDVNSNAGTLSNAGWLNGTTLHFKIRRCFPCPGVAIWTAQLTITTGQGDLKASTVTPCHLPAGTERLRDRGH